MITLLIVLVSLVGYLAAGFACAKGNIAANIAIAKSKWDYLWKESVHERFVITILFWPFVMPFFLAAPLVRNSIDQAIEDNDPEVMRERARKAERELEKKKEEFDALTNDLEEVDRIYRETGEVFTVEEYRRRGQSKTTRRL